MLGRAPIRDVHGGKNQGLRALADQLIGYAAVAGIVTYSQADLAPGRVPHLLLTSGEAIFHELHRDTFGLAKDNGAVGVNYKGCVVIVRRRHWIFAADHEKFPVFAAPGLDRIRDWPVKGVFAENEHAGVGKLGDGLVQGGDHGGGTGELHLHASYPQSFVRRRPESKKKGRINHNGCQQCQSKQAPPLPQMGHGHRRHEQKANAIDSVGGEIMQHARMRKNKAGVQPGKAEVIQFAAEKFQAGPKKRRETGPRHRTKPEQAGAAQHQKEAQPKGKDIPEANRAVTKGGPEKQKMGRINRQTNRQTEIVGQPGCAQSGQGEKTGEKANDQKPARGEGVGETK